MDIIALETDSVTPRIPDNIHLMFYEKHKNILNVWRHLACILEFYLQKRVHTVASLATQLESF